MPAIAAAIGAILIRIAGDILIQGLIAVGIGIATFTGVDVTLTWLKGQAVYQYVARNSNQNRADSSSNSRHIYTLRFKDD